MIKSRYDYKAHRTSEKDWGETLTVEGMTVSLPQMIERVKQGRRPEINDLTEGQPVEALSFNSENPLHKSMDPLTTMDEMQETVNTAVGKLKAEQERQKKSEAEKAEQEKKKKSEEANKASEAEAKKADEAHSDDK